MTEMVLPRKIYQTPLIGSFEPLGAIPALAAPLAFLSANSVAAFVGGAAAGVGVAAAASRALGNVDIKQKLDSIMPVRTK